MQDNNTTLEMILTASFQDTKHKFSLMEYLLFNHVIKSDSNNN